MFRLQAVFLALIFSMLLCACATHESETLQMRNAWCAGNTALAKIEVSQAGDVSDSSGDALIWALEKGAVYRANGDIALSAQEFEKALKIVKKYEAQADISLTSETASALINQSYIPYRGYAYDKIMLCAYLALDYIELGKFEQAEVALKQMQFFQENAFAKNLEEIEKEKEAQDIVAQDNNLKEKDFAKAVKDSPLDSKLRALYGSDFDVSKNIKDFQTARGKYANPFAYWLMGVYFSSRPADNADKNAAVDYFRFASESLKIKNAELEEISSLAKDFADGKISQMPPCTYIIFEFGCAPYRKQFKFEFPLYAFGKNLPYISFNLPYLEKVKSNIPNVKIESAASLKSTQKIADIDSIIDLEFKSILPSIITRTIASSAVKAIAQYAAQASVNDSNAKLAIAIIGSIYQAVTNDADLRTWTTLPKQISIARIANPSSGYIKLNSRRVLIDKNGINVIFIKQMSDTSEPIIRSFNLRK